MTRSVDGPALDDGGVEDGALLLSAAGMEVRESTWAGAYYCAHVLWLLHRLAHPPSTSIVRDRHGDPLVGFLHVPADPETSGAPGRPRGERHAHTGRVVACALRGLVDAVATHGHAPARILLTGFGPFAAVVSNPTGDFVDDEHSVEAAARAALGEGRGCVVLERVRLDVDDVALDPAHPRSLFTAVASFRPHAVLALGVHRASSIYRVEIEPTNAGLVDGATPRHERGRPLDQRAPPNRALARAIVAGARALGG